MSRILCFWFSKYINTTTILKCWPHHQLALSQQTLVPRLLLKFELLERETELTYHLIYVFRGIYHERQVHVRNSSVTQNEEIKTVQNSANKTGMKMSSFSVDTKLSNLWLQVKRKIGHIVQIDVCLAFF